MKLQLCFVTFALVLAIVNCAPPNSQDSKIANCPVACERISNPVCAGDDNIQKTFVSECTMRQYNCENNTGFKVVKELPCEDNYEEEHWILTK